MLTFNLAKFKRALRREISARKRARKGKTTGIKETLETVSDPHIRRRWADVVREIGDYRKAAKLAA